MTYFKKYFDDIREVCSHTSNSNLINFSKLIEKTKENDGKVILMGNGGSSAISSHCVVDFTKAAGIRAVSYSDAATITCFANDYGYAECYSKMIEYYADPLDLVVLISSSGESINMINAAQKSKSLGLTVVTFTGFKEGNSLSLMGNLNFWANSKSYNHVENVHQIWILSTIDYLISKKY
jgi:D-sedoheptulose 7-phosphate isomerase